MSNKDRQMMKQRILKRFIIITNDKISRFVNDCKNFPFAPS